MRAQQLKACLGIYSFAFIVRGLYIPSSVRCSVAPRDLVASRAGAALLAQVNSYERARNYNYSRSVVRYTSVSGAGRLRKAK